MTAAQEAKIGIALRTLMDANGFSETKIIGYEHNWNDAGGYPVQLVRRKYLFCQSLFIKNGGDLDGTSRVVL